MNRVRQQTRVSRGRAISRHSVHWVATLTVVAGLLSPGGASSAGTAGQWEAAGALVIPRYQHEAVALPDGRVMIIGGRRDKASNPEALASVELWDAETGWRSCTADNATAECPGPMHHARVGHTATLLADDRILVVGGAGAGNLTETATELYDPSTGQWTTCSATEASADCPSPTTVPRKNHSATLLTGSACDQEEPPDWCGNVLVAGSDLVSTNSDAAELYDPATGRWSMCPTVAASSECPAPMNVARGGALGDAPPGRRCARRGGSPERGWSQHRAVRSRDRPLDLLPRGTGVGQLSWRHVGESVRRTWLSAVDRWTCSAGRRSR